MAYLVHRRQVTVEWGHCDPAGIVFNSRFFEYFDTSSWALFEAALGVPPPKLGVTFDIVGIPLVNAGARFMAPVRFGDTVEGCETRVWAAADKDDPARLKSRPIPPDVIARFAAP